MLESRCNSTVGQHETETGSSKPFESCHLILNPFSLTPPPFSPQDLDETHLFIDPDIVPVLQEKIDGLMDKLYFSVINE